MYNQGSRMQERMNAINKEKEEIAKSVQNENVAATEEEMRIVETIVDKVSSRFAEQVAMYGNSPEVLAMTKQAISEETKKLPESISFESRMRIEKIAKETVGLGPIEPLLKDSDVTEIVVQRYDKIFIEKNGVVQEVATRFNGETQLENVITKIVSEVGRKINLRNPIVDARLKDGSRVNATFPPVTPDGATLTIRKFSEKKLTDKDYLRFGSIDKRMLYFCERCVAGKISTFISGGTGTGKTTFLNMLSNFISKNELIVTIEDTCELQVQSERVRRMETRSGSNEGLMDVDIAACVKNALRMRPDRIIVGEIRDGAVVDLLTALSTGHDGGISTGHANSPQNLINTRLPILYGMNKDVKISESAQKIQVTEAIQLIIQLKRFPNGARRVTEITEITGINENGNVILNPVFIYDEIEERFKPTGYIPTRIIDKCCEGKVNIDASVFDESIPFGDAELDAVSTEKNAEQQYLTEPTTIPSVEPEIPSTPVMPVIQETPVRPEEPLNTAYSVPRTPMMNGYAQQNLQSTTPEEILNEQQKRIAEDVQNIMSKSSTQESGPDDLFAQMMNEMNSGGTAENNPSGSVQSCDTTRPVQPAVQKSLYASQVSYSYSPNASYPLETGNMNTAATEQPSTYPNTHLQMPQENNVQYNINEAISQGNNAANFPSQTGSMQPEVSEFRFNNRSNNRSNYKRSFK